MADELTAQGRAELISARKQSRSLYWMVAVFSFFVNMLMLTGPLYMLNVYDRVLGSRSLETLIALSVLVAFLYGMMGILDFVRGRVMGRVGARFQARMDRRVFAAVLKATTLNRAVKEAATGLRDLESVQRTITSPALMALFDLPWVPIFLLGLWTFHSSLALLAIAGGILLVLIAIFLVWRIDSPRVERFRLHVTDRIVPNFDWAMAPVTGTANLISDFQSYQKIYEQNQELRRELQQMKSWKEAALQLEQENARLLDLNSVRLDPRLTHVTGVVMADSGSPYRQSVLLNVGRRDGVLDGWATMDGLGLVGRISGVGENASRVILLTDTTSRIPAVIQPSGQNTIVVGDNTRSPPIDFLENTDLVRPGDRVLSSGDGGVFPAGLVIGQVAKDPNGRLRVRLAADYERLEFLRVLRNYGAERIEDTGRLIRPEELPSNPEAVPAPPNEATTSEAGDG